MTSATSAASDAVTVLVYGSDVDRYGSLIRHRFPTLCVLSAKNTASLERHVADADIILASASSFPVKLLEKARRLRWFQSTTAGVESILPIRHRIGDLILTNARGIHGELIADFVMTGMGMMHWDFPGLCGISLIGNGIRDAFRRCPSERSALSGSARSVPLSHAAVRALE